MRVNKRKKRTFVLGIDGTPYSLLEKNFAQGKMPQLKKLAGEFKLKRISSVYPTISSVAWTSYMTGKNPAVHNIFGFVDRTAKPFAINIPTAKDRRAETIWGELSRQGKRVIVVNVPLTYPPEKVNGILVSGFLCPDIEKSCYPEGIAEHLKSLNYVIDADVWLARDNHKEEFMRQLYQITEKRFKVGFDLMEKEEWDFFQLHIMETDRLFHFFWDNIVERGEFSKDIEGYFQQLDFLIGQLKERLSDQDRLLILSDHGFCAIKNEVQLSLWLEEQGFLRFEPGAERKLKNYHRATRCYCLIPGRIFINLVDREEKASVPQNDYAKLRQEIKDRLLDFKNPQNGEEVIDQVFFREEIYQGPYLEQAADIIAHPKRGYDLKGTTDASRIFDSSPLKGMHTYDDAFALGINLDLDGVNLIQEVKKIIIDGND